MNKNILLSKKKENMILLNVHRQQAKGSTMFRDRKMTNFTLRSLTLKGQKGLLEVRD